MRFLGGGCSRRGNQKNPDFGLIQGGAVPRGGLFRSICTVVSSNHVLCGWINIMIYVFCLLFEVLCTNLCGRESVCICIMH